MTSGVRILPGLDADVVVVGGGPAGAATAGRLARSGLDVLIVEAKRFPRDKVCGDFVGPVALRELAELGVAGVPDYRSTNVIRKAALFIDGEELITRLIPQVPGLPASGRVIPREILDNWIFRNALAAGARVMEEARFTGFVVHEDHVVIRIKSASGTSALRARLLVGADGSTSSVAPALRGRPMRKDNRIIALRAYYTNVGGAEDQADLYFSPDSFPGYYWLFPAGRGLANLGVGMVRETLPPTEEHLRTLLDRVISQDVALATRLAGAEQAGRVVGFPLTTYDHSLPVTADRVMLVGDAAGLINPLNGEGIQYALLSARWAADAVRECAERGDWSNASLAPYGRAVRAELRYDMALSNLIVQLIRNRSLNEVWMRALRIIVARARQDPEYAYLAGGILAGLLPARVAMSRTMIGGTIGQATRTAAITTAVGIARDRRRFGRMGVGSARILYRAGHDVMRNPRAARRWSRGLGPAVGEFASQAAWDRLRRRSGRGAQRSRSIM